MTADFRDTDASRLYRASYYESLKNFKARSSTELTILLYHGVYDTPATGVTNYNGKHISAADFREQIAFVKKNCTVLTMDDVASFHSESKPWPKNAVAITFDDGFANNRTVAAEILSDLGVPATFYVCPGMMDTQRMFWVDQIEDSINACQKPFIALEMDGKEQIFPLGSIKEKISAVDQIKSFCKSAPAETTRKIVSDVSCASEYTTNEKRWAHYAPLQWKQLIEIAESNLFIVGGHSLYHDILSMQSLEQVELDIEVSIKLLEYNLKKKIRHYSYPEGQPHHYNQHIIDILKKNGIICSPSAIAGMNPSSADLFHLRRVMVGLYGTPFPYIDPQLIPTGLRPASS